MSDDHKHEQDLTDAISLLVNSLHSRDGLLRQCARRALVAIGQPAVRPLMQMLMDKDKNARWEAAKALADISDPTAAPALVCALEDGYFGVRWLAAEGLINMGRSALPSLMHALLHHPDSQWLREGSHHILKVLADRGMRNLVGNVLTSLEGVQSFPELISAARKVLDQVGEPKEKICD